MKPSRKPAPPNRRSPASGGSTPRVQWTLSELQKLIDPIVKLGSGAMLLAGVTMSREMTTVELERLTSRCLDEERCRRLKAQNAPHEPCGATIKKCEHANK